MSETLAVYAYKAPFPYFGGKATVAGEVWRRFGTVQNYVEPFFGSGAVLLRRPSPFSTETVNDLNGWLCNFWRAVRDDPDAVAWYADWPVSELDLHARGDWLFYRDGVDKDFIERLRSDPNWYCAKSAGWWVWGACAWIGSGWGPQEKGQGVNRQRPHLGDAGRGVNRKLPHLGNAGRGVNRQLPHLGDAGQGVNRKLPHLGNAGRGNALCDYFGALSARLREVRISCGDWQRVCGPSVTINHGTTAVFLDPPYATNERCKNVYTGHETDVSAAARAWAIEHGDNPLLRIALCGYDTEHTILDNWSRYSWGACGGYGNQGDSRGRANAARETIWFSPHCIGAQRSLFESPGPLTADSIAGMASGGWEEGESEAMDSWLRRESPKGGEGKEDGA